MSETRDDAVTFNRILSKEDKDERDALLRSDEAFIAAMKKASAKGREKVTPGTFVDTTPPIYSRRIRGDIQMSACGSPARMCAEIGARGDGAQTLRQ